MAEKKKKVSVPRTAQRKPKRKPKRESENDAVVSLSRLRANPRRGGRGR